MHSRRNALLIMMREGIEESVKGLGLAAVGVLLVVGQAFGQGGGGLVGNQAVGGISVDADGIVRNLDPQVLETLAVKRREALAGQALGSDGRHNLQKVSLRRILDAVELAKTNGSELPADVLTLGGLERIEYLFVDTDGHDLVLAGPGDTAVIDAGGNFVAATSGRPVLLLEDLVVSLRAIDAARMGGGMQCSIDPSPEGLARLQAVLRQAGAIRNPQQTFQAMEKAVGPQQISVDGVPADSHFAQVLVAADYRMKRIGMGLEPSGIKSLPSYLSMVPATVGSTMLPRFWLEARYEPIARDPDELTWKLAGRQMVCLTESDLLAREGLKRGGGRPDAVAARWCEQMTSNYDNLAERQPVFAELSNCVDLAVVAALIEGRQLAERAGLDLSPLLDAARLPLPSYAVPSQVPTVAHGLKRGNRWVVSASGGVQFQPWAFVEEVVEDEEIAAQRRLALADRPDTGFYWD